MGVSNTTLQFLIPVGWGLLTSQLIGLIAEVRGVGVLGIMTILLGLAGILLVVLPLYFLLERMRKAVGALNRATEELQARREA